MKRNVGAAVKSENSSGIKLQRRTVNGLFMITNCEDAPDNEERTSSSLQRPLSNISNCSNSSRRSSTERKSSLLYPETLKTKTSHSDSELFDLPKEILFAIFDLLSARDLTVFSNCCRQMCSLVFGYSSGSPVRSRIFPPFLRHMSVSTLMTGELGSATRLARAGGIVIPSGPPSEVMLDVVSADVNYALLVLFSTRHKGANDRARVFVQWFFDLLCQSPTNFWPSKIRSSLSTTHCHPKGPSHCVGLYIAGAFLYMVTARCHGRSPKNSTAEDQRFLSIVYQHLNSKLGLENILQRILAAPPGKFQKEEVYLRLFIMRVFLLPGFCNQDKAWSAFWLSRLFRPLSHFERAKFLLLLGAPCSFETSRVLFEAVSMTHMVAPTDVPLVRFGLRERAELLFKDLGDLLAFIHEEKIVPVSEIVSLFGFILNFNSETTADGIVNSGEDPSLGAFLLQFAGVDVSLIVLRQTIMPSPQNQSRLAYIVDLLFYMIGTAFMLKQTQKFAEVLDLIKRLIRNDGLPPNQAIDFDANFAANLSFKLGHRLSAELCHENSNFRRQLIGSGTVEERQAGFVFVGHLLSILLQRSIL